MARQGARLSLILAFVFPAIVCATLALSYYGYRYAKSASERSKASLMDGNRQLAQSLAGGIQQRIDTLQSQSDGVVGIDLQSWNTGFNPITGSSTSGAMGIAGSGLASQTVAPSGVPTIVFNQVPAAADPQAIAAAIAWKLRTVSV